MVSLIRDAPDRRMAFTVQRKVRVLRCFFTNGKLCEHLHLQPCAVHHRRCTCCLAALDVAGSCLLTCALFQLQATPSNDCPPASAHCKGTFTSHNSAFLVQATLVIFSNSLIFSIWCCQLRCRWHCATNCRTHLLPWSWNVCRM